ncbi:LiaF transmembrane domain-containing protein [Pedobacter ginsengisoli]|uniref:LiaF transmembrane domain-containing protein n=1 Tax=Pedobacter ginsengisoli TaxID=363852 RepID=UPI0025511F1C|nr:LiaF domain-containing protein [Pedobacter ginsengisoli]
MENCKNKHNNTSRIWSGLIILGVGLVFFLRNVGIYIPGWVISWHTLLIVIGLLVGYKRNFNGGGWLIMVLIGGFFTLEDITNSDFSKFYFAIGFIVLGLFVIFKPKNTHHRWRGKWKAKFGGDTSPNADDTGYKYTDKEDNDVLDSVNVFGGSHQNVYSKNFKGGDVIAIFGGSDINLTQADFQGTVTLDVVAIFGGMKIIIPPSWEIKSEITAIFGGMDDKRAVSPVADAERKILVIKGVALFGGVDIRNF